MTSIIKQKTLLDVAKDHDCKTIGDLWKIIKGKRLKTNGINRSGHNYPVRFTASKPYPTSLNSPLTKNNSLQFIINDGTNWMNGIYPDELCLDFVTINEMEKELTGLSKQQELLKKEIDLCVELGIDEYDERLIKTIMSIQSLKKSKTKDKVKEARDLILMLEEL